MNKKLMTGIALGCFVTGTASIAVGLPIQFADNGHWYEVVDAANITWNDANNAAAVTTYNGLSGHLATITSEEENDFIFSSLSVADRPLWLGGFQDSSASEPAGDWQWVTGELWSYTNWTGGEPNNSDWGDEDALAFAWFSADGTWNDAPMGWNNYGNGGYVVEYESSAVPEPGTMLLFGAGLAGVAGIRARRKKK